MPRRIVPLENARRARRGRFAGLRGPARILGALLVAVAAGALALLQEGGGGGPAATAASGPEVAGKARVVDGDTLRIGEARLRLIDIDAPEMDQSCLDASGRAYSCGESSKRALERMIGGARVTCANEGEDRYGRILARCSAGGRDLNAAMIETGWAVVYRKLTDRYAPQEASAEAAGRGMWGGRFETPWDHRDAKRAGGGRAVPAGQVLDAAKSGENGCTIKGNVSSKGTRIYHMPGQADYDGTRISVSKGERWFCSEAEARDAGWRRAKR